LDGKIVGVKRTSVGNSHSSDEDENNNARNHVGNGKEWVNQRTGEITGNDGPVKSDGDDSEAGNTTEDLVDNDIVWCNPAGEGEKAQELGNPAWEPVPDKAADKDVQEPPVSTN